MVKIDISLREVISNLPHKFVEILTNKQGIKLLDTSLPNVKDKRADLIVELEDKTIFHLELQSSNDNKMAYRMLEYYLLIKEKFNTEKIYQLVLYVGFKKINMKNFIDNDVLKFKYNLKDIREIDCNSLFLSEDLDDKIIAVLCNIENKNKYVNLIIENILKLDENERKDYIIKLLSFSRYRPDINERLLNDIKEKVMPITIDLQNDPYFNKGLKTGIQKGIQKGKIIVLKELGFSKEEIAKKLNISVYEIDKILKD